MNKTARILIGSVTLLLLIAGTAFAIRNPAGLEHFSPLAASHQPKASASTDADQPGEDGADDQTADEATDGPPSADLVARLLQRLSDAGVDTDAGALGQLIDAYGVGGAVRLLTWSHATGSSIADLQQLRDGGMGWGQIAKQLNDGDASVHVSPGIGWVMSAGHAAGADSANASNDSPPDGKHTGRDTAPGQNKH